MVFAFNKVVCVNVTPKTTKETIRELTDITIGGVLGVICTVFLHGQIFG